MLYLSSYFFLNFIILIFAFPHYVLGNLWVVNDIIVSLGIFLSFTIENCLQEEFPFIPGKIIVCCIHGLKNRRVPS